MSQNCAQCHTSGFIIPDLDSSLADGRITEDELKANENGLNDVFVGAPETWINSTKDAKNFGGDCNDCHTMKEPNPNRCSVILATIRNKTMPPRVTSQAYIDYYGEGDDQADADDYFKDSIEEITRACGNL